MKDPAMLCEKIQALLLKCAQEISESVTEYRDESSSMGISEAAAYLDLSSQTLRRLEKTGKLIPRRSPSKYRYYTKSQLDAYLTSDRSIPLESGVREPSTDNHADEEEFGADDDEGVQA